MHTYMYAPHPTYTPQHIHSLSQESHTLSSQNSNWISFDQKAHISVQLIIKVGQELDPAELQFSDKKCFVNLQ